MGLLGKLSEARMRDPVEGTARVSYVSSPGIPSNTTKNYSVYRMECVVSGPGIEPQAVEHRGEADLAKWPSEGTDLPIVVDRKNPKHFVVTWDQVPSRTRDPKHAEWVGKQIAKNQAAWAREHAGEPRTVPTGPPSGSTGRACPLGPDVSWAEYHYLYENDQPELRRRLEELRKTDTPEEYRARFDAPPRTAGPAADTVTQLKELADLRDRGALSDDEFAAQKAKLLGDG